MVTRSGASMLYQTHRLSRFCATTTSLPGIHCGKRPCRNYPKYSRNTPRYTFVFAENLNWYHRWIVWNIHYIHWIAMYIPKRWRTRIKYFPKKSKLEIAVDAMEPGSEYERSLTCTYVQKLRMVLLACVCRSNKWSWKKTEGCDFHWVTIKWSKYLFSSAVNIADQLLIKDQEKPHILLLAYLCDAWRRRK